MAERPAHVINIAIEMDQAELAVRLAVALGCPEFHGIATPEILHAMPEDIRDKVMAAAMTALKYFEECLREAQEAQGGGMVSDLPDDAPPRETKH